MAKWWHSDSLAHSARGVAGTLGCLGGSEAVRVERLLLSIQPFTCPLAHASMEDCAICLDQLQASGAQAQQCSTEDECTDADDHADNEMASIPLGTFQGQRSSHFRDGARALS